MTQMLSRPAPSPTSPTQAVSRPGLLRLLLLTIAVAFVAGGAELVVVAVRKLVSDEMLRVSRQIVWLAPLGELMLLLPVMVLLLLVGLVWSSARNIRTVFFALLFISLASVLLAFGVLHDVAIVVLAAGLAWRMASAVTRYERLDGLTRRIVLTGAVAFVLLGLGVNGGLAWRERRAIAALPAAPPGAPNIILVIWDTVRAASLALYGYDRRTTPNLERIARRGVVFERAIATAPWTLPSHASLFTGRLPHETSASWTTPLDAQHATLAETLAASGYVTGAFSANVLYVNWESGLDRGFTRFEDYRVTPGQILLSTALGRRLVKGKHGWETGLVARLVGYSDFAGRKRADDVNHAFLNWLDKRGSRPYFAFLNYFDAHLPYKPPAPYAGQFGKPRQPVSLLGRIQRERIRNGFWDMPSEELNAELAAYEESISYLDDHLGKLVAQLDRRGDLKNTLIVLVSDHGEEFREHGDHEHGSNLYMEQLHVPLVIVFPDRVPGGLRIAEPVSIRDVPATITELTGVQSTSYFPGESLTTMWSDQRTPRLAAAELTPGLKPTSRMRAAVAGRLHYIRNPKGDEELYDFVADPRERTDLSSTSNGNAAAVRLRRLLNQVLRCGSLDCSR